MKGMLTLLLLALLNCAFTVQIEPLASVEALLDELGMPYAEVQGRYKVVVELEGSVSSVILQERALFGQENEPDLGVIYLYTVVLEVPDGIRHPMSMLKKLAEINDNLLVGKVSLGRHGTVFYNSSLPSRLADAKSLGLELVVAHMMRQGLHEQLAPFLGE